MYSCSLHLAEFVLSFLILDVILWITLLADEYNQACSHFWQHSQLKWGLPHFIGYMKEDPTWLHPAQLVLFFVIKLKFSVMMLVENKYWFIHKQRKFNYEGWVHWTASKWKIINVWTWKESKADSHSWYPEIFWFCHHSREQDIITWWKHSSSITQFTNSAFSCPRTTWSHSHFFQKHFWLCGRTLDHLQVMALLNHWMHQRRAQLPSCHCQCMA